MSVEQVLAGSSRWWVDAADNLPWLRGLPDACCSLCVTSPPYSKARTYGIGFDLTGQAWVDWMAERVVEMCRVTAGLVCVNMAGQLCDQKYQPVVEWLVADLTRHHGLVCGPAPYVYFRFSIPGSGGEHYHRRDWEPVYCFARAEHLPLAWSDNTSMGHPPKWAPGGEMSNRISDGTRVNQWGRTGGHESGGTRGAGGKRQRKSRPSHEPAVSADERAAEGQPGLFGAIEEVTPHVHPLAEGGGRGSGIGREPDGSRVLRVSKGKQPEEAEPGLFGEPSPAKPRKKCGISRRGNGVKNRKGEKSAETLNDQPAIANPGNVIREKYPYIQRVPTEDVITLPEFIGIMMLYANATKTNAGSLLYDLREALGSQALPRWFRGVYTTVLGQAVLRPDLYGFGRTRVADLRLPQLQQAVQATSPWAGLLQRCLSLSGASNPPGQPNQSTEGHTSAGLLPLRNDEATLHPPQGRGPFQQRTDQSGSGVPILSQQTPPAQEDVLSVRETADGARVLSQAFAQVQDVWRSAYEEAIALARSRDSGRLENFDAEAVRQLLEEYATRRIDYGDVIRCLVGGGAMGSKKAHANEAPFSETLVEFFVRSYAAPGAVVLDPFCGSSTTGAVAVRLGRRYLGCDVRPGQAALSRQRLAGETPTLFPDAAP